jgi:hypothetical protein
MRTIIALCMPVSMRRIGVGSGSLPVAAESGAAF